MRFYTITILYIVIQFYLLMKARGFVRAMFDGAARRAGLAALVGFFIWVNAYAFYSAAFDPAEGSMPQWVTYTFVYPFYTWSIATIGLAILFVTKDIVTLVWIGLKKAGQLVKRVFVRERKAESAPVDPNRRKFFRVASASLAVPPIATASYGMIFGSREFFIKELDLHFPHLPENLRGLKVVQLSDIHCSRYTPKEDIAKAVGVVNDTAADLVLLTGDYVPMEAEYIYPCMEALKDLRSRHGVLASFGNHELWTNAELIRKEMERNGIPVFRNHGNTLDIRGEKLNVLGVEDSRWGRADIDRASAAVEPGHFNILMSHQPPYWDNVRDSGIDLTLSGHTHGGQIGIGVAGIDFNFGEFFGHRYNKGLFEHGAAKLYVNQGFGYTFIPVRLNTPPEITIITLT